MHPAKFVLLRSIPLRTGSALVGRLSEMQLPPIVLRPAIAAYACLYGCDMEEAVAGPHGYATFGDFFARRLRPGARPIEQSAFMVAPCDGLLLNYGELDAGSDCFPEPVKGIRYKLSDLIGDSRYFDSPSSWWRRKRRLYYACVYLAPGDYHRIHSPCDLHVERVEHVPGDRVPVAPSIVTTLLPEAFAVNERKVVYGRMGPDRLALIPVGSTNVGSIDLAVAHGPVRRGDDLGAFRMGSTVILVFSGPANMAWAGPIASRVLMGQPLIK